MSGKKMEAAMWCSLPACVWLCMVVGLAGMLPKASAATGPAWHFSQSVPNLNGTTTALWIKTGTTDSSGNYSGDTASLWTLDAAGHQTFVSPTYGPYAGWSVSELDPTYDGALLLSWTHDTTDSSGNTQEQYSLWSLNGTGYRTAVSPTYGPYPGWSVVQTNSQPSGTALVFWKHSGVYDTSGNTSGDMLSVWTVDNVGNRTALSPTYGPYPGWSFYGASPGISSQDGSSFLLWVNQSCSTGQGGGDQASIWKIDGNGNRASISPTYGPYPGWRADYIVPAYDGTARMLWTHDTAASDYSTLEQASVWFLDAAGDQTSVSPTYGPYPGWFTRSLQAAPDNTSRLLWVCPGADDSQGSSGDKLSVWTLDTSGHPVSLSPTYGPFPGWSAADGLTVLPDGTERIFWGYVLPGDSSGLFSELSVWSLNAASQQTSLGPTYGPYN